MEIEVDASITRPILVTGCTGQVGHELRRSLAYLGKVIAVDRRDCDLSRPNAVRETVRALRPWAVVNAAAYTAVDKAESDAESAQAVNATAVAVLAEETASLGAVMIHYSTDYVFDGSGSDPWVETDATNPLSTYGRTKLAGEAAFMDSGVRGAILRTSWVFGVHGNNFLKTMLRAAARNPELRVIADQIGTPTPARLLADLAADMLVADLHGVPLESGQIFHVTTRGETTWHGFASEAIGYAASIGWPVVAGNVHPIATSEWPTAAQRPLNSRLSCHKLESTYNLILPDWKTSIHRVIEDLLQPPLLP